MKINGSVLTIKPTLKKYIRILASYDLVIFNRKIEKLF
jgi:hypothetical protein